MDTRVYITTRQANVIEQWVRHTAIAQLGLIATVQVLAMTTWFSASEVVPALTREWQITDLQAVWLTFSFQTGFVLGAAIATASIAVWVDAFAPAVAIRVLTGVFLAGVYPVAMQLMAS